MLGRVRIELDRIGLQRHARDRLGRRGWVEWRHDEETHLLRCEHVLRVRGELAHVDDEVRGAGRHRERHHGHVRLAAMQRSERRDALVGEEAAHFLGEFGIHAPIGYIVHATPVSEAMRRRSPIVSSGRWVPSFRSRTSLRASISPG